MERITRITQVAIARKPCHLEFYDLLKVNGSYTLKLRHRISKANRTILSIDYYPFQGALYTLSDDCTLEMFVWGPFFPDNLAEHWDVYRREIMEDDDIYSRMSFNFGKGVEICKIRTYGAKIHAIVAGKDRGVELWTSVMSGKWGFWKEWSLQDSQPMSEVTALECLRDADEFGTYGGAFGTKSGHIYVFNSRLETIKRIQASKAPITHIDIEYSERTISVPASKYDRAHKERLTCVVNKIILLDGW